MKKKLIYLVTSVSLVLSMSGAPLAAHATSLGAIGESQADSKVDAATSTEDSPARTTRIENYKKSLKEALTAAAKTRITERCLAAQAVVKTKITNNSNAATARTAAYNKIVENLEGVVAKVAADAPSVDTAELQANITVLQTKIAAFTTANTTYQQSLTDLSVLDCKTDPTAFKAALEAARTDQQAVLTSAKDIRTYLTDTVKLTLQELKTKLDSAN